jgi:similar to stage IV sporulation protein
MLRKDFMRLRPVMRALPGTVSLTGKHGVPFFLWKFRQRYVLLLGLLACICGLSWTSRYVWEIELTGLDTLPYDIVIQQLESFGVSAGTPARSIHAPTVRDQMLTLNGDLIWLTVNIRGSRAVVEVRERIHMPELFPAHIPCDIIARRGGLVTSVVVRQGETLVQPGQTVSEGYRLVSGTIAIEGAETRYVRAAADIRARTWYELTGILAPAISVTPSGEEPIVRRSIVIFGRRINLYAGGCILPAGYGKISQSVRWTLPGGWVLPIVWQTELHTPYRPTGAPDDEAAESLLRESLMKRLENTRGPGDLLTTTFIVTREHDWLRARLLAESEELIGVEREIQRRH